MNDAQPAPSIPAELASRRRFFGAAGALVAGGVAAGSLAGCGSGGTKNAVATTASADYGYGDTSIVNSLLTLEYVENDFYRQVVSSGFFSGREQALFQLIRSNEQQHLTKLQDLAQRMGGPGAQRPVTRFPIDRGPRTVLRVAAMLEDTAAGAYLGQVTEIVSKTVLATALSIHTVEARQAGQLDRLAGQPFSPDGPFASPLNADQVLQRVNPFIQ